MKKWTYSAELERRYYSTSLNDRTAISYSHLDPYLVGSVGLDFFRAQSVLDIGAGEGIYSAWIADPAHGAASRVLGIELTEHRIRRDYEERLPNLRFVSGDIFEMEPQPEDFDVIFMNLVLHHLRFRLDDVLEYVRTSLKPNGKFLAFEPNCFNPAALIVHTVRGHSANEGFMSPRHVKQKLRDHYFNDVDVGYFWRDRWWAKNPLVASSFWIQGRK